MGLEPQSPPHKNYVANAETSQLLNHPPPQIYYINVINNLEYSSINVSTTGVQYNSLAKFISCALEKPLTWSKIGKHGMGTEKIR